MHFSYNRNASLTDHFSSVNKKLKKYLTKMFFFLTYKKREMKKTSRGRRALLVKNDFLCMATLKMGKFKFNFYD